MSEVHIHTSLLEAMPRSGTHRRQMMDFIPSLRDATQRNRQFKLIGDYAITCWHDSHVKIVMVVDIRHADR